MSSQVLWLAIALVLLLEGLLPFFAPRLWLRMMDELGRQGEHAVRLAGLCSIAAGLVMLWLA
ncbi:hypothetical protein AAV94_07365 [Lampropedia cohaerens]|uniref:DUF2065 domain-containing protein n=1 Tax=Lampropedia cohaerens TaxID=1610491 RepID=A0A0U1PZU6_9BURK|nr:DUF2065 family protein [Lampropedia cohaerens]KKW67981.1 hypothetical protein AAV94_07365 [Lampropedia cohaerens]